MNRTGKLFCAVLTMMSFYTGVEAAEPLQMVTDSHVVEDAIQAEMNRFVDEPMVYSDSGLLFNQYKDTVVVSPKKETSAVVIGIDDVVKAAIYKSRDIKMSKLTLAQAETAVGTAAAAKNPSVNYQWKYSKIKPTYKEMEVQGQRVKIPINHLYNQGINLTWPIWTGGAVEGAIDAARYGRNIASIGVYQAEAEAKLEAVKAYYKYMEALNLSEVAAEAVKNLDKHMNNVQQQYNAGIVAKLDVLASRVSLANAKQKNIAAQNGRKLAEANVNRLMGEAMDRNLSPADKKFPEPEFHLTMEEAIAIGQKYRWELIKAGYNIKIAKEKIRIAKSGYLPKVAVGGQYGWNTAGMNGFDEGNWALYGAISMEVFDGGSTSRKGKDAEIGLAEAQEMLLKAKDGIELEIRQAYLNVIAAKEQIETAAATVEQAEEAYKIAVVRYTSGVGINLDVLDAELALNQAKINHITALYNYNIGLAILEKAIGIPAVMHKEFQK